MEYLEWKKFHKLTCRYGGILLQHHAHIILQMFEKADCVAMCLTTPVVMGLKTSK